MKNLIAITAGEPESINSEIIAKTWNKIPFKNKLLIIGNYNLLKNQFKKLKTIRRKFLCTAMYNALPVVCAAVGICNYL